MCYSNSTGRQHNFYYSKTVKELHCSKLLYNAPVITILLHDSYHVWPLAYFDVAKLFGGLAFSKLTVSEQFLGLSFKLLGIFCTQNG